MHLYVLLVLFVLMVSCTSIKNDKLKNCSSIDTETLRHTFIHDNIERNYLLYVPRSISSESIPSPLVLNFHGGSGSAEEHLCVADMRSLAEENKFILVYPNGGQVPGIDGFFWNYETNSEKYSADDLGFITSLIDHLKNEYSIDSNRLYATGFSMGGGFIYALACRYSELISAISVVAGLMFIDTHNTCNMQNPISLAIFHGTHDTIRPIKGIPSNFLSISDIISYWKNEIQIPSLPVVTSNNNVTYTHYSSGTNDSSIHYYEILNGSHTWLDIDFNGSSTNDLMWDFFSN